jgi:hypothetical protein
MAQRLYEVTQLPQSALEASVAFHEGHLAAARALIEDGGEGTDLVILLPAAPRDHADWRRALARDLARAHAPARVNVIAGSDDAQLAALRDYLAGAKGVTGHYLEAHE